MTYTKSLISFIAGLLGSMCLLLAGCTAEGEQNLAPNYAKRAKTIKAELEAMAHDYGLSFAVNEDSLRASLKRGTFSKDSMKQEFSMMSKMNGYYPFVATKDNQIAFNSSRARLARLSQQMLPTRDVTNGKWTGALQQSDAPIALRYNISWPTAASGDARSLKLTALNASNGFGGAFNNDLSYQFATNGKSFTYRFTCSVSRGMGTYTYNIKGDYRQGASWATVAGRADAK